MDLLTGKMLLLPANHNSAKGSSLQKPIREPFKPSFSHLLNGHKIDENTFPDSEWAKYIF